MRHVVVERREAAAGGGVGYFEGRLRRSWVERVLGGVEAADQRLSAGREGPVGRR